ncbi:MAG TPA: hypothetical protein PKN29_08150 [Candidatus Ozemobacteraceae bacterium]|nr:hypothetical protein [Candidatus Ozemobacteraceae bacterium]
MKILKKFSVIMMLLGAIFMTGCDASQIIDVISKVAEGVQKAIPAIKEVINTVSNAVSSTNNDTADNTATQNTTNTAQETDKKENDASVVVINPTDDEEVSDQATATATSTETATSTQTSTTTSTATETSTQTTSATSTSTSTQTSSAAPAISEKGQQQMDSVVDYALRNHRGGSNGDCFNAVWGYLTSSGYGNLKAWGDLPNMGSDEAREFAEFMNKSSANLNEAGLQRLDTAFNPPITNPHDPRIPKGAVIVVAAGSYGTSHPTAGDIVIKAGEGRFVNDGPNMNYGTSSTWTGKLLGVYIPK